MGQPLDEGHHPVVVFRVCQGDAGAPFGEKRLQPGQPALPPPRAGGDVLPLPGGTVRTKQGVVAADLPPGGGQHLPQGVFLQRREIHQEGILGKERPPLSDDLGGRCDGDRDDDNPAARRELRKRDPLAPPRDMNPITCLPEAVGKPPADSPRPADDPDLKVVHPFHLFQFFLC